MVSPLSYCTTFNHCVRRHNYKRGVHPLVCFIGASWQLLRCLIVEFNDCFLPPVWECNIPTTDDESKRYVQWVAKNNYSWVQFLLDNPPSSHGPDTLWSEHGCEIHYVIEFVRTWGAPGRGVWVFNEDLSPSISVALVASGCQVAVHMSSKFTEDETDRLLSIFDEITKLADDQFDCFFTQYPVDVRIGTIVAMAKLAIADESVTMELLLDSQASPASTAALDDDPLCEVSSFVVLCH